MTAWEAGRDPDPARPAGELLVDLAEELRRLARAEIQLAVIETRRKAKRMVAAVVAVASAAALGLAGLGVLVASAVLGLAHVLPAWLAALSVGAGVFVLAGTALIAARFAVRHALPIAPQWMIGSVRDDVETIRRGVRP